MKPTGTSRGAPLSSAPAERATSFLFADLTQFGQTIESLAADDAECKVTPNCPNESYLASRGVYVTADTSLVVDRTSDLTRGRSRDLRAGIEAAVAEDGSQNPCASRRRRHKPRSRHCFIAG